VGPVEPSQEEQPSRTGRLPRRPTDRIEDAAAWVLTAAALFVVVWGVFVGLGVYGDSAARSDAAARELTRVDAVLLTDRAPPLGQGTPTSRPARYQDAAGVEHDVLVTVIAPRPAGSVVAAWVDHQGRVAATPPTRTDGAVLGVSVAIGVALLGAAVLGGLWCALRMWSDARNASGWAHEWTDVEPVWSGRVR
jgi:hypothetical protein